MTITEGTHHTTPPRTETRTEFAIESDPGKLTPSLVTPDVVEARRQQYGVRDRSSTAQLATLDRELDGVWPRILTRQATRDETGRTITATPWTVVVDKETDHDAPCRCWDYAHALGHDGGCCFQAVNDKGLRVWRADEDICHSAEHAANEVAHREAAQK